MTAPLVPPELLDRVVAYFHPRKIILFGSRARGEAGPDSDFDLLVVVDDDTPREKVTLRAGVEFPTGFPRTDGRDSRARGEVPAKGANTGNALACRHA